MSLIQNICMSTIILSITYLSTLNLCELERSMESIEAAAGGIAPWRPDCRLHWLDSPTAALQHIFIVCCVSARLLQHGALLCCTRCLQSRCHSSLSGNSCEPSHQAPIMRLYLYNVHPESW